VNIKSGGEAKIADKGQTPATVAITMSMYKAVAVVTKPTSTPLLVQKQTSPVKLANGKLSFSQG